MFSFETTNTLFLYRKTKLLTFFYVFLQEGPCQVRTKVRNLSWYGLTILIMPKRSKYCSTQCNSKWFSFCSLITFFAFRAFVFAFAKKAKSFTFGIMLFQNQHSDSGLHCQRKYWRQWDRKGTSIYQGQLDFIYSSEDFVRLSSLWRWRQRKMEIWMPEFLKSIVMQNSFRMQSDVQSCTKTIEIVVRQWPVFVED